MPKIINKKSFPQLADHLCFWTNDGRVLRNLRDLAGAITTMSDETFHYHVNAQKNDLACWIKEALQEPVFGRKMETMKTRPTALRTVEAELKKYQ